MTTTFTVWCGSREVKTVATMSEARELVKLFGGESGMSPDGEKYWISQN